MTLNGGMLITKVQKTSYYHEPKSIPKQIPLFEEQDDGNLVPYQKEE